VLEWACCGHAVPSECSIHWANQRIATRFGTEGSKVQILSPRPTKTAGNPMRRPSNLEGIFHLCVHRRGKSGETGGGVASWMFSCHFRCHLRLQIFVIDGYEIAEVREVGPCLTRGSNARSSCESHRTCSSPECSWRLFLRVRGPVSNPRPSPVQTRTVEGRELGLYYTRRLSDPDGQRFAEPDCRLRSSLMHQADDQERLDRRAGRVVLKRPGLRLTISGRPESQAERPAGRPRASGA
jgi:hypothetical protein